MFAVVSGTQITKAAQILAAYCEWENADRKKSVYDLDLFFGWLWKYEGFDYFMFEGD